jgi:hypothetical protein
MASQDLSSYSHLAFQLGRLSSKRLLGHLALSLSTPAGRRQGLLSAKTWTNGTLR